MHLGVVLIDLRARFVLGGLGVSYFLMSDENWCFWVADVLFHFILRVLLGKKHLDIWDTKTRNNGLAF